MVFDDAGVPELSAVVVSYRTGPVLDLCLSALLDQSRTLRIIVVDNGNHRRERHLLDRLAARHPCLTVVRPGRNLGFAAACNLGARQATTPVLAFVNPDLICPAGTMAGMLKVVDDFPDAWLLGARLLDMDGAEQRGGRRETLTPWRAVVEALRLDRLFPDHPYFRRLNMMDGPPPDHVVEVPAVSGALMVMRRDRFWALGGMDEDMFLHTEDVDLCLRVLRKGGRILYCGHLPVRHQGGTSDVSRLFVELHKTRSTVRYFFKHFLGSYPAWVLRGVALLLWLRLAAIAAVNLPGDSRLVLRRLRECRP